MARSEKRELVWAEMQVLERLGLGRREIKTERDKFVLRVNHPRATRLTTVPEADGFIRSEAGSLLFRKASVSFLHALPAMLRDNAVQSEKGVSFRWSKLSDDDIRLLFAIVRNLADLGAPAA